MTDVETPKNPQKSEVSLQPLLAMIEQLPVPAPADDTLAIARLQRTLRARRRQQTVRIAFVFAAAAGAACAWFLSGHWSPHSSASHVAMTSSSATILADGSQIDFDSTPWISQGASSAHVTVIAQRGRTHFHVIHTPATHWDVIAGPYVVRVVGTEFTIQFTPQQLDVDLIAGAVRVLGPELADDGFAMHAGQHFHVDFAPFSVQLPVDPAPAPSANIDTSAPSAAPSESRSAPAEESLHWVQLVAKGQSADVITSAEKLGISHVLAVASIDDVGALADAARYQRRFALARQVLLAARSRFAGSRLAHEAAFFLGSVCEADATPGALGWYDTYLNESPTGAYAAQALGRKMLIVQQQQGSQAAKPIATEYLRRFASGPHAGVAKKIVGE